MGRPARITDTLLYARKAPYGTISKQNLTGEKSVQNKIESCPSFLEGERTRVRNWVCGGRSFLFMKVRSEDGLNWFVCFHVLKSLLDCLYISASNKHVH